MIFGTITRRLGSAIALTTIGVAATACNVPGTASPTPATLALPAFTVTVPGGWNDKTSDATETGKLHVTPPSVVVMLVKTTAPGSFQANVNDVIPQMNCATVEPTVAATDLKDYFTNYGTGTSNFSAVTPITVDGESGLTVTYDTDIQGTPGRTRDIVVNHKGVTYDFAYTTSVASFDAQLGDFNSTIASLKWKA